jgi:hypothetical protein
MTTLNNVLESLDNNKKLSEEIKDNFKELIINLSEKLSTIDLSVLKENLETLSYDQTSSYVTGEPINYDRKTNKLVLVSNELKKDYDAKYLLMMDIIEMAANRGKENEELFTGINKGIASGLATALVGNEGVELYYDESACADIIDSLTKYSLIDAYFQGNYQPIIDELTKNNFNPEKLKNILEEVNYNLTYRHQIDFSKRKDGK